MNAESLAASPASEPEAALARPPLRVVRGNPDAAELAALVTVLAAVSRLSRPAAPPPRLAEWASKQRLIGAAPAPGWASWRASGLPR